MVDTLDLGSSGSGRRGSSPLLRTTKESGSAFPVIVESTLSVPSERAFFCFDPAVLYYSGLISERFPFLERGCWQVKSEMISQEKNLVTIRAEIENETFEKAIEDAYRSFAKKANIKGFRKGKVPRKILEMYVGREAVQAEALESLVPKTMREVVTEYELDLIAEPQMDIESMEAGAPVVLKFVFEVRPEVILPELAGISVERPLVKVEDFMIEEAINELQRRHATFSKVEERPAGAEDALLVDYRSWIDGVQEKPEEAQESLMDLTSEGLRKEIVDVLTGAGEGDVKEARIAIEEDYPNKEIAGKTITYEFIVKEVQEKILPELDDDFAKTVREGDSVETMDDLRKNIQEKLLEQFEAQSLEVARSAAVAQLSQKAEVEVPDTLVEQELEALRKQEAEEIKRHMGQELDEYLDSHNIERDTFDNNLRQRAIRVVRQTLVPEAFADERELTVEEADLDAEMGKMAASYNLDLAQVKSLFFKDPDRVGGLIHRLRMQKTVDALLSEIEVREVENPSPAAVSEEPALEAGEESAE